MNLLAIDPGTTESAYVILNDGALSAFSKVDNEQMRIIAGNWGGELVLEMVASYGMPVGREVFETVYWGWTIPRGPPRNRKPPLPPRREAAPVQITEGE
jgi:hypothetical protein